MEENRPMGAILLDVDGVLHVSGEPIPGAAAAVDRLRRSGHRLRFVTNSTTRSRADLADDLRSLGVPVEDDELQTIPGAAARALAGRRVLALVMDAIVGDLDGVELVGEHADAVLVGGADETEETGRVFSYTNLARAFAELEMGAELYCLHRNRWWQTSRGPLLDSGAFVVGLEYAAQVDATVLGKPSTAYFAAALEAIDADPDQAWIVGDDIESDIAGGAAMGLRTALVRTGKFREDDLRVARTVPDLVLSSVADLPEWLERS
jgi:HAD superfamily hydrolase (TIGR01458 family)